MIQERLLDTRRNLQKLADQSGISLQDILKYLSSSQYSLNAKNGRQDEENQGKLKNEDRDPHQCELKKRFKISEQSLTNKKTGVDDEFGRSTLEKCTEFIEESILNLNKASTSIIQNVVDQMVTKKIYKIRQNFRGLILNILGVQQFSFYVFHDQGHQGRIEYQDFSSNFITQLMDSDSKYLILQKIVSSMNSSYTLVDLADNSDLSSLFQIKSQLKRNQYYGIVINPGSNEQKSEKSLCLMIKSNNGLEFMNDILVPKLINKIVEISQISSSQGSAYLTSKIYTKKMLDLLQVFIIQYELKLRKCLCNEVKINKQLYYNLTGIIKIILSKIDQNVSNQQSVLALKKLSNQFEQMEYKKIQQIRFYKKYVRESSTILLEFNRVGVLLFISGNTDNQYLNDLSRIWEQGKPVLDQLFAKNQKFDSYVKKAIRGSLKQQRPLQISDEVQVKITTNSKRIQKIHVIIKNKELENKSDSKQFNKILEDEKVLKNRFQNRNSNFQTINQIQRQNPGISNEGWLQLFIKNNRSQRKSLMQQKKNNTYTHSNLQSPEKLKKKKYTYVQPKEQLTVKMEDILIDNPNLNFLIFNERQLEQFAFKLLNSLDYFQRLPQEIEKLKHFISDLHDGYEIHSNSFHNFKHGVNVMHTCYLLSSMPANLNILTVKDIFVNVFSGLCHDVGHTGFTNAFQIASMSKKAMIYNDKSPLQNFHASFAFEILRREENNFLCHMDRDEFSKFRKAVIENILYTDIKQHFPLLNNFNELIKSGKTLGRQDASILSNMIVHSSDFSGSIKQFQICRQWSQRVNLQFSSQYKVEGEIGIPQTPFMKDLNNILVLSKAECGFLKVIVYPLYQALDNFYVTEGIAHKFKKNIENNIKAWQQINKSQTQKARAQEMQKQNKNI